MFNISVIAGFDRRSCKASSEWEPEAPVCEETLCPPLVSPEVRRINTRITPVVLVEYLLILAATESNQKMQQNITFTYI